MKLSKTTIKFSEKRNIDLSVDDLTNETILTIFDSESDEELYLEYLVNKDGSFSYKFNMDFVSPETKEELPAFIKNEKHLREVITFIAAEAA